MLSSRRKVATSSRERTSALGARRSCRAARSNTTVSQAPAAGATWKCSSERTGNESAKRRDRRGVVALRSHWDFPSGGNLRVGEPVGGRIEGVGGKAELARL